MLVSVLIRRGCEAGDGEHLSHQSQTELRQILTELSSPTWENQGLACDGTSSVVDRVTG